MTFSTEMSHSYQITARLLVSSAFMRGRAHKTTSPPQKRT